MARLALLYFKVHVHLNSILMSHFSQFKPFDYLTPSMLKVRIPSSGSHWEGGDGSLPCQGHGSRTVANFLGDYNELTRLSDLIAWDFTLGMVIGCYLVRPAGETHRQLMMRLDPFLFIHLKSFKDQK